jgi:hypothetical protein
LRSGILYPDVFVGSLILSIFGDLCLEQEEGHHQMKALYWITGKHPTPFLILSQM